MIIFALFNFFFYILVSKKDFWKKNRKTVLILTAIIVASSLPSLTDFFFHGHDLRFHLTRIVYIAEELENGQFPVRMMTGMLNGYGYANSLYYCDLFLYVPSVMYAFMVPLSLCYNVYVILTNAATALISYYCFKRISGNNSYGLLGSLLYTLSTYHLLCVYTRAATGEYTALAFLPLVLLGMYLIYTTQKVTYKEWMILAFGMSGIALCHVLTGLITIFFLIIICIIKFKQTFYSNRFLSMMKAAGVTLLVCSWFLVPFLDSCLSNKTSVMGSDYRLEDKTIYPFQFFSIFSSGNPSQHRPSLGLPLLIGIALVIYYLYITKDKKLESGASRKTIAFMFGISAITLVTTFRFFPWAALKTLTSGLGFVLRKIQFPWRLLGVASLVLIVAIILALKELDSIDRQKSAKFKKIIVLCVAVSTSFFFYSFTTQSELYRINYYYDEELESIVYGENMLSNTTWEELDSALPNIVEGNATIESYEKRDGVAFLTCTNDGASQSTVNVPILAYDNYKAVDSVSGQEFKITKGENNRITFTVPPSYNGTVKVKYVAPLYWRAAEIVSLLSVIAIIAVFIRDKKRKNSKMQ